MVVAPVILDGVDMPWPLLLKEIVYVTGALTVKM